MENPALWPDVFDEKHQAVLKLADAVSAESHAIDPSLITLLQANFGEGELAELILVCGQANLNNRAGNAAKQLLGDQDK